MQQILTDPEHAWVLLYYVERFFFLLSPLLGNSDEISFRTFFKLKSTFRIYSIGSGTTVIIIKALHI